MGVRGYIAGRLLNRLTPGRLQRPGRIMALRRLPTLLRLGYVLFKDERVPVWQRVAVVALLGLIFSPVDIANFVPVVGQFWDYTLAVVVLDAFIQMAPADVVNEHIRSLKLENKVPLRRG